MKIVGTPLARSATAPGALGHAEALVQPAPGQPRAVGRVSENVSGCFMQEVDGEPPLTGRVNGPAGGSRPGNSRVYNTPQGPQESASLPRRFSATGAHRSGRKSVLRPAPRPHESR